MFAAICPTRYTLPCNRGMGKSTSTSRRTPRVDRAMENSSEGFLAANRSFSQATRDIESIQAGREAATRGRSEDIIPAYQPLRPQGQAAFRAGYVDPANRSNPRLDQQSSPAAQRRVPRRWRRATTLCSAALRASKRCSKRAITRLTLLLKHRPRNGMSRNSRQRAAKLGVASAISAP